MNIKVIDFISANWIIITSAIGLIIFIATLVVKNFFPKELPELEKVVDTANQSLSATGDFVKTVESLKKP